MTLLDGPSSVAAPHAAAAGEARRGPILVALEQHPADEVLLRHVRPLAERSGLPLVLWHTVPADDARRERAARYVASVAAGLRARGVSAGARLATGPDADVELARELRAIRPSWVAGLDAGGALRRRPGRLARRLLGSGAPALLSRSSSAGAAPVRLWQVLVPLDGSARAARILPAVADLARAHGARVLLLRVSRRRDHLFDAEPPTTASLAASLLEARRALAAVGVEAVTLGRFGDPAAEVVACAEERGVELIALTTGRRRGPRRWLSPSVTDHVLREFAGAVLVRDDDAALAAPP